MQQKNSQKRAWIPPKINVKKKENLGAKGPTFEYTRRGKGNGITQAIT